MIQKKISYLKGREFTVFVEGHEGNTYPESFWRAGCFSNHDVLTYIKENIPLQAKGNVIEVGADIGNNTLFLSGVLDQFVYVFEPNKSRYDRIAKIAIENGITTKLYNYALSDYSGFAHSGTGKDNILFCKSVKDVLNVRVTTMDMAVHENIDFIFIDVKDQESNILSGAARIIKTNKPDILVRTNWTNNVLLFLNEKLGITEYKYVTTVNGFRHYTVK